MALRAKMNACRKLDIKLGDTKMCVVTKNLSFDDYNTCLFDGKTMYTEQIWFESKTHEVYTVNKHTIALNRDNDKKGG